MFDRASHDDGAGTARPRKGCFMSMARGRTVPTPLLIVFFYFPALPAA